MSPRRLPRVPARLRPPTWVLRLLAVVVAIAIPALTLPQLPRVSWVPVALGLLPWVVGKYLLCPLRWHALSESGRRRWWHIRAYAESELMGLLTPGHVGADLWRVKRLSGTGMQGGNAVAEVALDRLVGAIGLAVFVVFAGAALPTRMLLTALGIAAAAVLAVLVLRRVRPSLVPTRKLPRPRQLAHGVVLSMG
jgi:glycosyltransferase 2 family protein